MKVWIPSNKIIWWELYIDELWLNISDGGSNSSADGVSNKYHIGTRSDCLKFIKELTGFDNISEFW